MEQAEPKMADEYLASVAICVEDKPSKRADANRRAEISGTHLREF
jgi:hypothetical protein